MFESSVIVENESLSCPRCEKINLKISHGWKGFKYTKMLENQIIYETRKDFSEEQQTV